MLKEGELKSAGATSIESTKKHTAHRDGERLNNQTLINIRRLGRELVYERLGRD